MESFMVARILPKQKVLVLNRVSWHDWHTLKSRLLVILIFPKTCSTLHQFTTCRLVPLKLIQWQITRKIIRMPFTSRHSLDKIHERKAHPTVHKHEPSRPQCAHFLWSSTDMVGTGGCTMFGGDLCLSVVVLKFLLLYSYGTFSVFCHSQPVDKEACFWVPDMTDSLSKTLK